MEAVRLYKVSDLENFMLQQTIGLPLQEAEVLMSDRNWYLNFIVDDLKETHENLIKH